MASYLSVLIQAAEPANYKLNYDEHYLISVPIATTTTPGIAAFDSDYFVVENGVVKINPEYEGNLITIIAELEDVVTELGNKVDKIIPANSGYYAYVVYRSGANIVNTSIRISVDADDDTIVMRTNNGRIRAQNGVGSTDVVNKGQLTEATTNIPKSALASGVQASLEKADTAYQKPDTGIPEIALAPDVRTKLNKAISRVGISPEAWEALPDANKDVNTMYFVGPYGTAPNQYFVEWMYFVDTEDQGHWEAVGSTQSVDFSNYYDKTDIDNMLSDYAKQDGYYPTMHVGVADQIHTDREIDDAEEACPPVVFGTVGGSAEVQSGLMPFPELRGKTIKWNQLVQNGNFDGTNNWNTQNATISASDNIGSFTASAQYGQIKQYPNLVSGHKYLLKCDIKLTTGTTDVILSCSHGSYSNQSTTSTTNWQSVSVSFTAVNSGSSTVFVRDDRASNWDAIQVRNFQLFDLTAIYGAGKEPSTVAEFVRDFPMPYYPYNAGTLLSSKSSSVDFIKRNQWDEIAEVGTIDDTTGQDSPASNRIRSKNYIPVLPGVVYFAVTGGEYYLYPYFYDGAKNYIGLGAGAKNGTITVPANAAYMRFIMQNTYGTTYNHDICIYVNWETPGLPYVPYSKQTIMLPNLELRSAGSAYDVLYQQGGGKRRIGSIDLGSLTWYYLDAADHEAMYSNGLQSLAKFPASDSTAANILCVPFTTVTRNQQYNHSSDFIIAMNDGGTLFVYSTTMGTTGSAFKTAMSGIMLYYEFAEETDITTTENPGWTEYAEIDNFGTVKFNQDPAQDIPVPQAYFVRYTVNLVEFLDSAYVVADGDPNNLATKGDLSAKLDKVTGTTTYQQVYGKYTDGGQVMMNAAIGQVGDALVRRNASGQIYVPATPTEYDHATSKQYVDAAVGQLIYKHTIRLSFTYNSTLVFIIGINLINNTSTSYTALSGKQLLAYLQSGCYSIITDSYNNNEFWSVVVCPSNKYIHGDTGFGLLLTSSQTNTTIHIDGIDPDYNTDISSVTISDVVTTW